MSVGIELVGNYSLRKVANLLLKTSILIQMRSSLMNQSTTSFGIIPTTTTRRATKSMTNKLKVGIVGAPRGQSFVRSFQAIEETDVTAICDLNIDTAERVVNQFNIDQRYNDFEKMIQSDLDIIVVSTPMPLHAPQSTIALQEGKHVISEVPAATDLQQCWKLVQSVEDGKNKYMMAENYVYMKPNILIRELAKQGLFGDIYFGEGQYIHELKAFNEITKWRRKWQTGRNG